MSSRNSLGHFRRLFQSLSLSSSRLRLTRSGSEKAMVRRCAHTRIVMSHRSRYIDVTRNILIRHRESIKNLLVDDYRFLRFVVFLFKCPARVEILQGLSASFWQRFEILVLDMHVVCNSCFLRTNVLFVLLLSSSTIPLLFSFPRLSLETRTKLFVAFTSLFREYFPLSFHGLKKRL